MSSELVQERQRFREICQEVANGYCREEDCIWLIRYIDRLGQRLAHSEHDAAEAAEYDREVMNGQSTVIDQLRHEMKRAASELRRSEHSAGMVADWLDPNPLIKNGVYVEPANGDPA